jgi:hypothetical protein
MAEKINIDPKQPTFATTTANILPCLVKIKPRLFKCG